MQHFIAGILKFNKISVGRFSFAMLGSQEMCDIYNVLNFRKLSCIISCVFFLPFTLLPLFGIPPRCETSGLTSRFHTFFSLLCILLLFYFLINFFDFIFYLLSILLNFKNLRYILYSKCFVLLLSFYEHFYLLNRFFFPSAPCFLFTEFFVFFDFFSH